MINFDDDDDYDNCEDFKMTMMSYRGRMTVSLIWLIDVDWQPVMQLITQKANFELSLVLVAVSRARCSWWAVCQSFHDHIYLFENLFETILLDIKEIEGRGTANARNPTGLRQSYNFDLIYFIRCEGNT